MAKVDVKISSRGIIEICKSPEMRAALKAHADKLADAANRDAYGHEKSLHISEFKRKPYDSAVDELDNTCVGVAFTKTKMGGLNEAKFKSLSKQNH